MNRRTALGVLALGGCDAVGALVSSQRAPVIDDELTPEADVPAYHIAPAIPTPPDRWKLVVGGMVARPLALTLDELRALPATTVRIRHHSVRGWTAVADWTGVRVAELAARTGARPTRFAEFRSFDAPDDVARPYWSSWDRESATHPHTLVAYAMNGRPLSPARGAPCRLVGSIKLGYKLVKYLTEISFLDVRTGGYWEARGFEWFAGV